MPNISRSDFLKQELKKIQNLFSANKFKLVIIGDGEQKKRIEKLQNDVPEAVLTEIYNPGKTDGSGNNRKNLRNAIQILNKANYELDNNSIVLDPRGMFCNYLKVNFYRFAVKENFIKTC